MSSDSVKSPQEQVLATGAMKYEIVNILSIKFIKPIQTYVCLSNSVKSWEKQLKEEHV